MATDWEEIKKLAADFQRAQLSTSAQQLSEKNCVEIIQKIIELKLLDVIFTSDGKEYLTPDHLSSEIQDELFIHGGRVHLTELAQILNVDFTHVEARASELVSTNDQLHLVLGQIINNDYLDHLAEEVNEKLHQQGQVSIASLTKVYDLPGDFLQQVIDQRYGSIIQAQYDPFDHRMLFTPSFVARHRAQISGSLMALTMPTPVAAILSQYNLQERIFYTVVDELTKSGKLAGFIQGARQERATYIPDIYSKSQNEYVDSFYNQNKYLEYDLLSRLGISDPVNYIKKRFKDEDLFYLKTCCIGSQIVEQMDGGIDEAISTGSWLDVMPMLPSILSENDANALLQSVMKKKKCDSSHILSQSVVISSQLIKDCLNAFEPLMTTKAQEDMKLGIHLKLQQQAQGLTRTTGTDKQDETKGDKKDERRKRATGGKAGGGTQGRETKTKAVKKKYHNRGNDDDEDDNTQSSATVTLHFMDTREIKAVLSKLELLDECSEQLIEELADFMHRSLTKRYEVVAKEVFNTSMSSQTVSRKKAHDELNEKVPTIITNLGLFEKGILVFPDDTQALLYKHLLKTTCSEVFNLIFSYIASEHISDITLGSSLTAEVRQKHINKLPNKVKEPIQKVQSSINTKDTSEFNDSIEALLGPQFCDIIIKKVDKKKERQILFNHRQSLLSQLNDSTDFAMTLHIAVLILFQTFSGCMLHASGKFVPQVIKYLQPKLPVEAYEVMHNFQGLVIESMKSKEDNNECNEKLQGLVDKVKELAVTLKPDKQSN